MLSHLAFLSSRSVAAAVLSVLLAGLAAHAEVVTAIDEDFDDGRIQGRLLGTAAIRGDGARNSVLALVGGEPGRLGGVWFARALDFQAGKTTISFNLRVEEQRFPLGGLSVILQVNQDGSALGQGGGQLGLCFDPPLRYVAAAIDLFDDGKFDPDAPRGERPDHVEIHFSACPLDAEPAGSSAGRELPDFRALGAKGVPVRVTVEIDEGRVHVFLQTEGDARFARPVRVATAPLSGIPRGARAILGLAAERSEGDGIIAIDDLQVALDLPPAPREAGRVWIESDGPGSAVLVLDSKEPLYGGQVLLGYDPRRMQLVRVARGPDFPAGDGSLDLVAARGCDGEGLAAAAVRWTTGSRAAGPLPAGLRRLGFLFFDAAEGRPGECSPLRPLPCADVQFSNTGVGQDEDLPLAIEDRGGEVCPSIAFQRGDANADGAQNITDAIFTLVHLYAGGAAPPCLDAADANDDGALNITDPIFHLLNLFGGGAPPPAPYPDCGPDPTADPLGCDSYPGCKGPTAAFPENEHYGIFNRFSIRREAHLGCDRWHPGGFPEDCTSPGAFERAPYTATAGGTAVEIPWLATRFLAAAPDSTATITLSPVEAMNESTNHLHARSPLFVRALVDGQTAEPGEVRLTIADITDASAFTFVRKGLAPGLHVVTFDWRVEPDAGFADDPIALLRGASVLVRTGIDSEAVEGDPEDAADLLPAVAHAPAEPHEIVPVGPIYDPEAWENILGEGGKEMFLRFFVPNEECVVALTFSAEVKAEYWTALDVRALVDESPDHFAFPVVWLGQALSGQEEPGVVLSPVRGFATRSWTFLSEQGTLPGQIPVGWHRARFQMRYRSSAYLSDFPSMPEDYPAEQTVSMDRRSAHVAVAPKQTGFTRMLFAQAGPDEEAEAPVSDWDAVPGVGLSIEVPENAHVAAVFQGEMRLENHGHLRLTLDGAPVDDTESTIVNHLGAFSHAFALKHLPAGSYQLGMEWQASGNMAQWTMGTRSLLAVFEELPVPDLGTGPDVARGSGQDEETLLADPIEPHHRVQRVLAILIDPRRPQMARVRVTGTTAGPYVVTLNGADHAYNPGNGATVVEIRDGLMAAIQGGDQPVAVDALADDLFRVRAFDGDLGEDVFTIAVSAPGGGLDLSVAQAPLPVPVTLDQMVFGPSESVADYWRISSGDRLRLEPALLAGEPPIGVLGPFEPLLLGVAAIDEYWGAKDCADGEEDYAGGHAQRYHEGLLAADESIDFSQFDDDRDGHLEHAEVIFLLITPQTGSIGFTGTALEWSPFCSGEPLQLDGVFIPEPTEWYTGNGDSLADATTLAHELGHAVLDLDDQYVPDLDAPHEPGRKSIMAETRNDVLPHLDGFQKLALGWVSPRVVRESGEYELEDVKTGREVLILPRAGSLGREYFLIEHRLERDLSEGLYDHGIGSSGLLVWHVLESTATGCDPLLGTPDTCLPLSYSQCMGGYNFADPSENYIRRALRLIRPGLQFSADGSGDAWNGGTPDILDDEPVCPDDDSPGAAKLRWGDGTPSGYQVLGICGDSDPDDGVDCDADAGPVMRFTIDVEG